MYQVVRGCGPIGAVGAVTRVTVVCGGTEKKEACAHLATLVALMFLKETMGVVLFSVPSREPREVLHPWPLLMNVVAVGKRDKKGLNGAVPSLSQTFLTHDRTVFVLG